MTLQERDARHLWHPYTQHQTAAKPLGIVRGKDALLWDEDGKEYIDAIASWWVNPFGHSNEALAKAAYKQLTELEHVLFGGFTHRPAVELAEKLISILPSNQQKLFFSDNGSTAVEIAIKMALQYFFNKGEQRFTVIALENAFHGDTFAAMAASGISFFTEAFADHLLKVVRIPAPVAGSDAAAKALRAAIAAHNPAAFIFEPLVQGAVGMNIYPAESLDELIRIAKESGVLTIADEVMTGFGRTGRTFASNYLTEQPDIMCLSKALTGGTIPLAVTTATQAVFDAFYSEDINKALFHGHTYTANPTGCAIALEAIHLLESEEMQANIQRIMGRHKAFVAHIAQHPKVQNGRTLGVIMAFELKTAENTDYYGSFRDRLYNFFISEGVLLRPVGNTIYILPPYIISDTQLSRVYEVIEKAIERF
ncbi:adenosylmethionine-8-amino-7-oxononanoate aminotransferase [Capnocytophaga haemolytica]|uniref:Adenosylmethionine-8-amino-7-oxononanoate aminotransferase n=1 Tax=Capnocytophaga haemolytica TaxID=45243 RepID=A0AAX2H1W8_9FLAO|nr:adenosylmethionine--8-amino-7-oxononanoate transaminase [Capnocytophaga haemolytica]AMD85544.1 adenosylmethionine-8-amino-7-oxononanoate aminotransferase [Capnocytophaga haemolytica]SFO19014.1 adenosylmethionine-8-amino-7-oxononanoate aminotransferase [Capnocytophaga haemolytica]SNV17183.1 Adenosylmethionine-8-amino-7-oxononanoate aminotransferase [Capnocytophaga haemolytica]